MITLLNVEIMSLVINKHILKIYVLMSFSFVSTTRPKTVSRQCYVREESRATGIHVMCHIF